MHKNFPLEIETDHPGQPGNNPAEMEVALLRNRYCKTMAEFFEAPASVSLSRAARAMYRLGRVRQWQAINATARGAPAPNVGNLRSGVLESLAGSHAMVVHRRHWYGTHYNKTDLSDLALQVAMLLALDWRDLGTFALREWFGQHSELDNLYQPTLSGAAGMIVGVAGQALDIKVPEATFRATEAPLAAMTSQWRDNETAFVELALQLADRHLAQSHGHSPTALADFDQPVEQAVPVELLMLLRLRGYAAIPRWLAIHPAMAHPAVSMPTPASPVPSQRCDQFVMQTARLLPEYQALCAAIAAQQASLRANRFR
ncbi:hypothetical protein D3C87_1094950 [compost metagenome]|uniref:Uncharacterized protein n=1 Tax=Cupriavidus campinensis TaxID=151783 RepID=A0AAE9I5S9_9BURK|nr:MULTISPECIES: hypothetical protein [Cupriavidus]TSP12744.1 hypothetical protein FGG12_11085 [Cupriavidus campinensis]URF06841.1 hypothetical protein M5D45_27610 [Cupriavidus campinensis]